MTRSKQREQAFQLIFEALFDDADPAEHVALYNDNVEETGDYAKVLFSGVCANREELDNTISSFLTGWKINRIAKVNLAILRLAVYEILFMEEVPDSVAINEAVELAKKYGTAEDAAFVNGVLGSVARSRD